MSMLSHFSGLNYIRDKAIPVFVTPRHEDVQGSEDAAPRILIASNRWE